MSRVHPLSTTLGVLAVSEPVADGTGPTTDSMTSLHQLHLDSGP